MAAKKVKKEREPYITGVHLKNIRGFEDLELGFEQEGNPRMRTLIIGQNGTGKTTILRCIALAIADFPGAVGLMQLPNGSLTLPNDPGHVELRMSTGAGFYMDIPGSYASPQSHKTGQDDLRHQFVVGYGINRSRVGKSRAESRGDEYRVSDSVLSLFDPDALLTSSELTLRRLKDYLNEPVYYKALRGLTKVFNLPEGSQIDFAKGGGVQITAPGVGENIPLEGWADGHRQTFQWIMDFYGWAMRAEALTEDGGVKGILLIDEIEQHLHPSQQLTLMNRLSELFPELQIIATTHSPLVALGVEPHELIALKRQGDAVVAVRPPDYRTYSVEDLIKDDLLFDTPVYSPKMQQSLSEYQSLAARGPKTRSAKQNKALAQLAQEIAPASDENDPVLQEIRKLREELKK
ncbi:MAG: AAA family ATPase [Meiothermus sp.]|nr:AAA family ATPase [Meiothermus sp.]